MDTDISSVIVKNDSLSLCLAGRKGFASFGPNVDIYAENAVDINIYTDYPMEGIPTSFSVINTDSLHTGFDTDIRVQVRTD